MRKIVVILMMLIAAAVTASAEAKVIRESKWNDVTTYKYTLMYDEDNTYGGSYYIYRYCDSAEVYDKIIGKDILTYWLEREGNYAENWEFTDEMTTFSQEENKFIIYVRVTRK